MNARAEAKERRERKDALKNNRHRRDSGTESGARSGYDGSEELPSVAALGLTIWRAEVMGLPVLEQALGAAVLEKIALVRGAAVAGDAAAPVGSAVQDAVRLTVRSLIKCAPRAELADYKRFVATPAAVAARAFYAGQVGGAVAAFPGCREYARHVAGLVAVERDLAGRLLVDAAAVRAQVLVVKEEMVLRRLSDFLASGLDKLIAESAAAELRVVFDLLEVRAALRCLVHLSLLTLFASLWWLPSGSVFFCLFLLLPLSIIITIAMLVCHFRLCRRLCLSLPLSVI